MTMSQEYLALIEECRQHCLWFLEPRAVPTDREGQFFTLECVERYGRREEFQRARRLKEWLLHHSNEAFVVSLPGTGRSGRAT